MNLVLDNVKETMRGKPRLISLCDHYPDFLIDDEGNESSRSLGLVVARGTLLVLISPVDGSEEIANPFQQAED